MTWAKVLDQTRCIGCHACSTACKSENGVPLGVHRTYVKAVEIGAFPAVRRAFQVTRWFGDAFRAAHPEIVDALTRIFLANDIQCYQATCEMLGNADLRPLLPSITAPTAVVVGEEDYATPVAMAEALHRAIPQSTLTVIPKGRHITPAEKPGDIATQILNLMRKH